MGYSPGEDRRSSLRLRDYDYRRPGAYFITVCAEGRACLFGRVGVEGVMRSPAGEMLLRWWRELEGKFRMVHAADVVVMPNHLHGLIVLDEPPCATLESAPLSAIVQWFKTMTTNEYIRGVREHGWPRFQGRLWQRSYHDWVIRNAGELAAAQRYIAENPARWHLDRENPDTPR